MKHLLEYAALRGVLGALTTTDAAARDRRGRRVGDLWFRLDRRHRELAVENIVRSLSIDRAPARGIARAAFRNLGRNLTEFALLGADEALHRDVAITGLEHLDEAVGAGRGVLLLSAHCGNWELAGAAISRHLPVTTVYRPVKNPRVDALVARIRRRAGIRAIEHRRSMRGILRALGRGEAVGILLDQHAGRREAVLVDFLGRPAAANIGLALMALRTGAPVLPLFDARGTEGRHHLRILPPVALFHGPDRSEELGVNTARFTAAIGDFVRAHPEQWFWVHNRWKAEVRPGDRVYRP